MGGYSLSLEGIVLDEGCEFGATRNACRSRHSANRSGGENGKRRGFWGLTRRAPRGGPAIARSRWEAEVGLRNAQTRPSGLRTKIRTKALAPPEGAESPCPLAGIHRVEENPAK